MKIKFNSLGYAINYVFILIFFDEKCIYANRIFQNINFICFHEDEKNWNNTVILDQLVFYSSRVQCSNSIQFYGSCTVVKALAKIADEFSKRTTVYLDRKLPAPFFKFVDPVQTTLGHTWGESWANGTSCSLISPLLISQILFRCLIFNCYNISICKKKSSKI